MDPLNWPAIIVGTLIAFALGMLWFGPIFGKAWAKGSHGIKPPARLPVAAMLLQLAGTFLLALVIGLTAQVNALGTAIAAILALAVLQLAGGLFSQKSGAAALIDGGYVVVMGALMILIQGLL
ncbi:hypothetical protein DEA8626_00922 [Defluviimonas aquaemixtae]|uniref:Twitching motility protein PilT n=1 Tax=Albidovulum aquaemixtae TaxID=1542388 RepID=A0A2R8B451_9RHOB|nr:DUF1761 domain-containing protein [Defluviimonas aquaemixtae]SPH17404.1 hypothetical protein DEA8626_00922 [Defluviimonas aquaemixtae]